MQLGEQNDICWNYLGLLRGYGLDHFVFKTYVVKVTKNESAVLLIYFLLNKKLVNKEKKSQLKMVLRSCKKKVNKEDSCFFSILVTLSK